MIAEAVALGVIGAFSFVATLFVFGLLATAAIRYAATGTWRLFPRIRTGFETPEDE